MSSWIVKREEVEVLAVTSQQLLQRMNNQHIKALLWNFPRHSNITKSSAEMMSRPRSSKRNFFGSAYSLLVRLSFSSLMLWVTASVSISIVFRAQMWRWNCDALPTFRFRLFALNTFLCFRMELQLKFVAKEGRSVGNLFCSFSFSRIIAYVHSNDETFIEI